MAIEKTLNTRIKLRYDSHENWLTNDPVLLAGEVALAVVTVKQEGDVNFVPSVLMKVGDGTHKYSELGFTYAKAADVLDACKTEAGLTAYVNGVITDAKLATADNLQALTDKVDDIEIDLRTVEADLNTDGTGLKARVAAAEGAINTLNGDGEGSVAKAIADAIAALDLANTYEAKGEAAKVQKALDDYQAANDAALKAVTDDYLKAADKTELEGKIKSNADAIELLTNGVDPETVDGVNDLIQYVQEHGTEVTGIKADIKANADAITAIKDGETLDSFADVEGAINEVAVDVEAIAESIGTVTEGKTIVEMIEAAQEAATYDDTALSTRVTDLENELNVPETGVKARLDALEGLVGETDVETQIGDAIEALDLENTYDAKGAADQALTDAKAYAKEYADGLNTAMDTRVQAVEGKAHEHANKALLDTYTQTEADLADAVAKKHAHANADELDLIATGDVAKWNAAEQNAKDYAKDYADGLNTTMDGRVAALEGMFGDGEGTVEAQIEAAVAAEAKAREDADKALQEQITANDGEIAALQGLVGEKSVETQITEALDGALKVEGAEKYALATDLAAEAQTARAAEKANADAIAILNGDGEGSVAKQVADAVAGIIDGAPEAYNTLKEISDWIEKHPEGVAEINSSIKANADAIEALETLVGTLPEGEVDVVAYIQKLVTAEENRAKGIESGLDTRLQAVEAAVGETGSVATAIEEALTEAKGYTDEEVKKLAEGAVATNASDIETLKGLVGDTKVEDQISAVTDPMAEQIEALEGTAHEHANKDVLDGISDAQVSSWDAKVDTVTAAADSGLKATRTGNDIAIEIDDSLVFIFDCGDAEVQ